MLQNVFQQFGGGIAQNNLSQRVVQGKIEDRIYAGINTVCSLASKEIRCDRRIEARDLAHCSKPWMEEMQLCMEIMPELPVYVRKCVEPKAIERSHFCPPQRVLAKI